MSSQRICVTLPPGLRDRAHAAGINVSGVATAALLRSVQALEKETGEGLPAHTPAVSSCEGVTI